MLMCKHKIWMKFVAIAVVCLFLGNTISYAQHGIVFTPNSNLQVQSPFNSVINPKNDHEFILRAHILGAIKHFGGIDNLDKHLNPTSREVRLDLYFEKKRQEHVSDSTIIPCTISYGSYSWEYEAIVTEEDVILRSPTLGLKDKSGEDIEGYNNWADPSELEVYNFQYGILDKTKYYRTYQKVEEIFDRLWRAANRKEERPELYLLESEFVVGFISRESYRVCLSLGLIDLFRKYQNGVVYDEDIAFVLAHELSHYIQFKDGIFTEEDFHRYYGNEDEVKNKEYAAEYDADNKAIRLMNKAGYSVRNINQFFAHIKQYQDDHKMNIAVTRRRHIVSIDKIIDCVEGCRYSEVSSDQEVRGIVKGAIEYYFSKVLKRGLFPRADGRFGFHYNSDSLRFEQFLQGNHDIILNILSLYKEQLIESFEHQTTIEGFSSLWVDESMSNRIRVDLDDEGETVLVMTEYEEDISDADIADIEGKIKEDIGSNNFERKKMIYELRNAFGHLRKCDPVIPYLQTHPIDEDRISKVRNFIEITYMKQFHRPFQPLTEEVLLEIDGKTETTKDLDAVNVLITGQFEESIRARIEELDDWADKIFLLAKARPALLTDALYDFVNDRLNEDKSIGENTADIFRFQLNIVFSKKERNMDLPILDDVGKFIEMAPIYEFPLGVSMTNERSKDERYGDALNWLSSFYRRNNEAVCDVLEHRLLKELNPEIYFCDLIEKYKRINTVARRQVDIRELQKSIDITAKPLRDHRVLDNRTFLAFMTYVDIVEINMILSHPEGSIYRDILERQFIENKDFMKIVWEKQLGYRSFLRWTLEERIDKRYLTDEVRGLGETYQEHLRNIQYIFSGKGYTPADVYLHWLPRVYEKFKPETEVSKYTYEFIEFLIDHSSSLGEAQAFSDSIAVLAEKAISASGATKETVIFKSDEETGITTTAMELYDKWKTCLKGDSVVIELKDGKVIKDVIGMSSPNNWNFRAAVNSVEYGLPGCFYYGDIAAGEGFGFEDIRKITVSRPVDNKSSNDFTDRTGEFLLKNVLQNDKSALRGISPQGINIMFLLSRGVLTEVETLICRYFENMSIEEVTRIYTVMKKYFTADYLQTQGLWKKDNDENKEYATTSIENIAEYLTNICVYLLNRTQHNEYWRKHRTELAYPFIGELQDVKNEPINAGFGIVRDKGIVHPVTRYNLDEEHTGDGGRKKVVIDRSVKHVPFEDLESSLEEISGVKFEENQWEQVIRIVVDFVPPSVFRNYILYYLFCKYVLAAKCDFMENDIFSPEALSKQISLKGIQEEVLEEVKNSFRMVAPHFVEDKFISDLNMIYLGRYVSQEENRNFNFLSPEENSHYSAVKDTFVDYRFSEVGREESRVDLHAAEMFHESLLQKVMDDNRSVEDRIAAIEEIYSRPCNTRDEFLVLLSDNVSQELMSLGNIEKIADLMCNDINANRAKLKCLEKALDENRRGSFEEEYALIVKYFPEKSNFRDDILHSFENDRVSTRDELEQVRQLYTFDFDLITEKENAKRERRKDNVFLVLRNLIPTEKRKVLLWLMGLTNVKPDAIKKIELLNYSNLDSLIGQKVIDSKHYKNIGVTARKELLEQLLIRGDESLIRNGNIKELIDDLWNGMVKKHGIDEISDENRRILRIVIRIMESISDDPERQFKILSNVIIEIEKLDQDKDFKERDEEEKLAKIVKTFLGSSGIIGVKIGQYLSTSTNFNLSKSFQNVLGELTEHAEGIDKGMIFSVMDELGLSSVAIGKIRGKASIKTVFDVRGSDEVFKVKNLQVFYEARQDLSRLEHILSALHSDGEISFDQSSDLLEELKRIVKEETDFDQEKTNARKLAKNNTMRDQHVKGSIGYRIIMWLIDYMLKSGEKYVVGINDKMQVQDNMVIRVRIPHCFDH